MKLPYDIARCGNGICPRDCARKQQGHPTHQVFINYEPMSEEQVDSCDEFIDNNA